MDFIWEPELHKCLMLVKEQGPTQQIGLEFCNTRYTTYEIASPKVTNMPSYRLLMWCLLSKETISLWHPELALRGYAQH